MIARATAANAPFAWVAADTVYGVGEIETALRRAGKGYVLGVPGNHLFRSWANNRRSPGWRQKSRAHIDPSSWKRLSAGEGTKGARLHDWAYSNWPISTRPNMTTNDRSVDAGSLIRRNIADGDMAFFSTWCPYGTGIETLVKVEGHRWAIEDSFKTAKNELGSTIMKRAHGTAGIVTSRSSCSPSP